MDEFQQVTVKKKANLYYNGMVSSRTVQFADGSRKTLGIMLPGDYEFSTGEAEKMEVLAGQVEVQLQGTNEWQTFDGTGSFHVPANSSFRLRVHKPFDYCCSYLKK